MAIKHGDNLVELEEPDFQTDDMEVMRVARELRFIAIKETLIQMRNEDERELVECAKSNLATMARCGDLSRKLEKAQRRIDAAEESANQQCTIRYMVQDELDAAKARIAELEAQLAAALATIERAVAAWHILE